MQRPFLSLEVTVGIARMDRDNNSWIAELGERRESTLAALRDILLRNLRKALANRPRVDESFLEDSVQEALLRILDKLDQFEGRSRFVTWSTSIAIRIALGQLRRSQWKDVSLDDLTSGIDYSSQPISDTDSSPVAKTLRQALLDALQDAIVDVLTDRQRTALLAELKGMPQDDIASHLGSNRNAIYKLTHDARKKLKTRLEAIGYTAEDVFTCVT